MPRIALQSDGRRAGHTAVNWLPVVAYYTYVVAYHGDHPFHQYKM